MFTYGQGIPLPPFFLAYFYELQMFLSRRTNLPANLSCTTLTFNDFWATNPPAYFHSGAEEGFPLPPQPLVKKKSKKDESFQRFSLTWGNTHQRRLVAFCISERSAAKQLSEVPHQGSGVFRSILITPQAPAACPAWLWVSEATFYINGDGLGGREAAGKKIKTHQRGR